MGPGTNADSGRPTRRTGPDFFRRTLGDAQTAKDPLKYSTRDPDVEPADQKRDWAPNSSAGFPRLVPAKLVWASDSIASSGDNVIPLWSREHITAK